MTRMTKEDVRQDLKTLIDYFNDTDGACPMCLLYCLDMLGQEPTTRQGCENCKILELLVDMEIPTICEDDYNDCEYCEQNCNFKAPTKECYLHWAEHKRKAVSE